MNLINGKLAFLAHQAANDVLPAPYEPYNKTVWRGWSDFVVLSIDFYNKDKYYSCLIP